MNPLAPSLKDVLAGEHLGVEDDPDVCPEDWQPLVDEHRDAAKQGDPGGMPHVAALHGAGIGDGSHGGKAQVPGNWACRGSPDPPEMLRTPRSASSGGA